jgi:hypothetical protein
VCVDRYEVALLSRIYLKIRLWQASFFLFKRCFYYLATEIYGIEGIKKKFVEFNVINVTFGGNYHEQGFFSWGIRTRNT